MDIVLAHADLEAKPVSGMQDELGGHAEVLLSGFGMDLPADARTSAMTDGQVRRSWPEPPPAPSS
ncbi:hypothetical protein [Streptomyces sp. NBC_00483]|uniref:hypothetical protein n=1 Tax=Streptomyces sp. NBC_00483 TaxID=2975756 RepID=UPI002E19CA52